MPKLLLILFFCSFAWAGYGQCEPGEDTTPPTVTCSADQQIENDPGVCYAYVPSFPIPGNPNFIIPPTYGDNCPGIFPSVSGIPTGNLFPVGTTTLTWTIRDTAGNTVQCTQLITVIDTEAPTINASSPDPVAAAIGLCEAYVNIPLATAVDNCGSSTIITNSYNSNGADASDTYPVGTTTVTFTATDGTFSDSFDIEVIVVNGQSPVITLNGDSSITLEACSEFIDPGASVFDNCLGDISSELEIDNTELDLGTPGTYTIRYNVTNATGITGEELTRTITVVDTTAPIVTLEGANPQQVGNCSTYVDPGVIIDDGCVTNIANVVVTGDTIDTSTLGTYTITYSFTDDAGNPAVYLDSGGNPISTLTRTVEVIDVPSPVVELLNNETPQIIQACTAYNELGYTVIDFCTGEVYTESNVVVDTSGLDLTQPRAEPYIVLYTLFDENGIPGFPEEREVIVVENTYVADAGSDFITANCTVTSVNLQASVPPSLITGTWSVVSGQTSGFGFSDVNDPNAIFTGDTGQTYTLEWTVDYALPCADLSDQMTITISGCDALDFDGVDDNVTFSNNFNFNGAFSIEIWVKSESPSANIKTVLSKRETNNQIDGYDLRLVNNVLSFNYNNGESLSTSPHSLNNNTWHHVAVTFDGSVYSLYVDGILFDSKSGVAPITNTVDFILGAMEETQITPTGQDLHFDGGLDELRIWDVALTEVQIRQMMNQEIYNDGGILKGKEVNLPINGLSWSDLTGYYQMNQISDISSGALTSSNGNAIDGTLRAMSTFQDETAPIPFETLSNGSWDDASTWLYGNARSIPNSLGIDGSTPIEWNIIKVKDEIQVNRSLKVSSLIIDGGALTVSHTDPNDGHSITIDDYLHLVTADSRLVLVGESQLLQDDDSVVDYSGSGRLERDQQGTASTFNYNYWASPVSADGVNYQIGSVLYDGNQNVQWTSGLNGNASTTPITLSRRWLYLYENYPENNYASWNSIDENTPISVGLGYIAKGPGSSDAIQNYRFKGQPNNGTYTTPINPGNEALVGNPYPSAIDAQQFIMDNSESIQGTLYFWIHYDTNTTHVYRDYQGGYASYNMTGGNEAVSPPEISDQGSSSKIPERYVPVGQGFFVVSDADGGNVTFNNGQRLFVKEAVTGANDNGSVFMRNPTSPPSDPVKRIRLNFYGPEGAKRPLLLGFAGDDRASDGFDYGYDAINTEYLPSDAGWSINDASYIIQGVGDFEESKSYPLNVKTAISGSVTFELQALENFENPVEVYLYDALLDSAFPINDSSLEMDLEAGDYQNRFFIIFQPNNSLSIDDSKQNITDVRYLIDSKDILIRMNPNLDATKGILYNNLGQEVKEWDLRPLQNTAGKIKLPVYDLSEGLYIFELKINGKSHWTKLLFTNPHQ